MPIRDHVSGGVRSSGPRQRRRSPSPPGDTGHDGNCRDDPAQGASPRWRAVDDAIARAQIHAAQGRFLVTPMFEQAGSTKPSRVRRPFAGVPYLLKDMYDIAGGAHPLGRAPCGGGADPDKRCAQVKAYKGRRRNC